MSRKEKQNMEDNAPEILLARILALRAMLSDVIESFMDSVGKYTNVVDTESVIIKLIGRAHDNYLMLTPAEKGDVKLGDLRAFSGYDLVHAVADVDWTPRDHENPRVMTLTDVTVPHSDLDEWDKTHVQFMCDLSNRRAIDELLRRGMYED